MQPSVRRLHTDARRDYPGQFCSIAKSLEVIGERWSLLIVRDVLNGNRRFGEIQESLGIARNVLSARLRTWSTRTSSNAAPTGKARRGTSTS